MGDGLLLEFPSVVDAIGCAIAIHRMMAGRNADIPEARRIVYRLGVHLGDVLIEGDDILGEGVNIAARLEGLCEPGGVLISSSAHEHVQGRIEAEFVDLGEKREFFFKPGQGFASRGLLDSAKVGRARLQQLLKHRERYIAQRRIAKPSLEIDGVRLWTDLRVRAYRGEIVLISGRASRRPDRLDLASPGGWLLTYPSL